MLIYLFKISLQEADGQTVALLLVYRFRSQEWVLDHKLNGQWSGQEVLILLKIDSRVNFQPKMDYSIFIEVKEDHFVVTVDDYHLINYRHRMDPARATHVHIDGPIYVGYVAYGRGSDLVKIFTDESSVSMKRLPPRNSTTEPSAPSQLPPLFTTRMLESALGAGRASNIHPSGPQAEEAQSDTFLEKENWARKEDVVRNVKSAEKENWIDKEELVKNIKSPLVSNIESTLQNVKSILVSNAEPQLVNSNVQNIISNLAPDMAMMLEMEENQGVETKTCDDIEMTFCSPQQTGVLLTDGVTLPRGVEAGDEKIKEHTLGLFNTDKPNSEDLMEISPDISEHEETITREVLPFPLEYNIDTLTVQSPREDLLTSNVNVPIAKSDTKGVVIMDTVHVVSANNAQNAIECFFEKTKLQDGNAGSGTAALPKSRLNILNPGQVTSVPAMRVSDSSQEINVQFPESSEIGREEPAERVRYMMPKFEITNHVMPKAYDSEYCYNEIS